MRLLLIATSLIVTLSLSAQSVLFERLARFQGAASAIHPGPTHCDLNRDGHLDGIDGYSAHGDRPHWGFRIIFGDGQGGVQDVTTQKSPLFNYEHWTIHSYNLSMEGPAVVDIDLDGVWMLLSHV